MISVDMIVTWTGVKAGSLTPGEFIDSIRDSNQAYEGVPVTVLGPPVDHACQRIETPSGCVATCSNNALVYLDDPDRPMALRNCQHIGVARIACLIDGSLQYEPAIVTPVKDTQKVAQVLIPDGAIIAGQQANRRILFTLPR